MATAHARFSVTVDDAHLLRVRWQPRIVLRDCDGEVLTAAIREALPGRRVHLMMFLNGMESLSQDALAFFARKAPLSAVALIGPSVLDEALIELYLEVYLPPFPVAYFDHEDDAGDWLAARPAP
ncbi:hypothetical protein FJV46_07010 [Arthrobacter agilis]|uniref:DUF7793 family protein n=1 Tax=Arthrobacter agilis TaxID=37921 RepID=UPI000B362A49|nr:hypothetical protein [Arthrobacter agilis]OUM42907.1 hypothetical protein B8W74_06530 [Arthrobacter agilis]PPB45852.1 hypothetical protein CI784_08725 [Arthrobacter agilis]TPV25394.1 hypothetical protein FJV46_07010 [Arthrobacter agilis]VDR33128.1 Uncharacterised protein [Arthrobacter agilis]